MGTRPSFKKPAFIETRIGSRFTPGVKALIALFAVTYILSLVPVTRDFIWHYLLLRPVVALSVYPYQLVVAPAIMVSVVALLFLALLLWSIGSAVEDGVGTRRFLFWMGGASLAASVTAAVIGRFFSAFPQMPVLFDGQPIFMAILVAFAHLHGSLKVRMWGIGEAVSGRALSYFFVGIGFVADLLREQWLQLAAEVAAVLFMLVVLYRPWRKLSQRLQSLKKARKRSAFEVLDGGRGAKEKRWVN